MIKLEKGSKVGFASDHAGFYMKENLRHAFSKLYPDVGIVNFGTDSEESTDYPDYGHRLAEAVASGDVQYGIASCGTANGITISMNRHQGVRAAIAWNRDIANLVRQHNNANILSIPGRFVPLEEGIEIMKTFFGADFEGGRHQKRIDKIEIQTKPNE